MNTDVQNYINQMKTEYELQGIAKREREKQNLLDKTGMFKKEYAPKKSHGSIPRKKWSCFLV